MNIFWKICKTKFLKLNTNFFQKSRYTEAISELEEEIASEKTAIHKLCKDLDIVNGECIEKLNLKLKELSVERQAYHSMSFIGNHCHKLLKVRWIST